MLGYRDSNGSMRVMGGFRSFIKYLERQAVFGSVKMSVHDQARIEVGDVANNG